MVCDVNIPERLLKVSLSTGLKCLTQLIAVVEVVSLIGYNGSIIKNDY
jgi:hypothetical protein